MKITARGEYGSRAMIELALQWGLGVVPLSAIAAKQGIPRKFLEQLVADLRNAHLVHASRGAMGGYQLVREPARITLLEIVEALEGPLMIMDCEQSPGEPCGLWNGCGLRDTWATMERRARDVLAETTLQDLADRQRERERETAPRTGLEVISVRTEAKRNEERV